ncbi:MAG: M48 family metallopeptidase, partial [Planctomycetota bacterium]
MPMNFFEHQERARKKTQLLVFLFALAVVGIGLGIYLTLLLVLGLARPEAEWTAGAPVVRSQPVSLWQPQLFFWSLGGTAAFVGLVSLFRTATLKQGGGVVARMLGGRLVSRDTRDLAEKRLLNIVDEMAIASGIPVPEVYVLDGESGINAFAAGFSTDQAAVAVTRGTLETLDRDELQGVIAHEFSHILNGDMRLNIRLIGILFGILAIAVTGRFILRSTAGRSSRRGKGSGAIVLLGLALMLIGYIGVVVGRMIQAAVSRQREFLADASAVQFTRNPHGIGGALLKIAQHLYGSALESPRAAEVSHLLFGEGSRPSFLASVFATHPPLEERVRRIDPSLLAGGRKPR